MSKSTAHKESFSISSPVDLIEETAILEDWGYHRLNHHEIILEIPGRWEDYHLQFAWQEDMNILQFYCIFDIRIQPKALSNIRDLLALINKRLPLGHFEISADETVPSYRYNLLLLNPRTLTADYLENLISIALFESERFYPAFQFVIWGGKSAQEAASIAMLETLGEA